MMERFSYKVLDFQKTTLVSSSGQPWTVPNNGTLRIEFINQLLPPTLSQVWTRSVHWCKAGLVFLISIDPCTCAPRH